MYWMTWSSASRSGTIVVSTQNRCPSFARSQISPRQTPPWVTTRQSSAQNSRVWRPDCTTRWFWPISSARE